MFSFVYFSLLVSNDHIPYLSLLTTEVCLHYQHLRIEKQGFILPELEDPWIMLIRETVLQIPCQMLSNAFFFPQVSYNIDFKIVAGIKNMA